MKVKIWFRLVLIILLSVILLFSMISYAWLAGTEKKARTDFLLVETPPILYVRDYEANESVNVINLENMVIGEKKQIIFCIVPRADVENQVNSYDLEIIYTNNLGETIKLYQVTRIGSGNEKPSDFGYCEVIPKGTNNNYYYEYNTAEILEPDNTEVPVDDNNTEYDGIYQRYNNKTFTITGNTTLEGNTAGTKLDCYILEISWEDNKIPAGVDPKEVDLIYIVAKGSLSAIHRTEDPAGN